MFVGHYALALAAKKAAPQARLGTFIMAAQWLDLLWPIFLLLGIEQVHADPGNTKFTPLDFVSYPWSHSLAMALVWSILFGGIFFLLRRNPRGAIVVALLVLSHWVLDWLTHRPDLPLYPGGPKVGLGLWNSVPATMIVELGIFAAGCVLYFTTTRAKDRIGSIALWAMIVLLLIIYFSSVFGSNNASPPTQSQIAWVSLVLWLFIPWGYWIDRHRTPRSEK